MKKTLFFRKRLDNPNGLVKDSSNNEMEQNETRTQNPAKPSNSTAGLLAHVAEGVVSFVANLFPQSARKEGVRSGQESFRLRALFQTTAIGTLYGLLFAGLLLALFPIQSSVSPCSKIYQWNIHLFPITADNTIPLNLCLEDHDEFIPSYHQIGKDLSREVREIKIDYAECKEDANDAGKDCLIVCGAVAVGVNVRNLFRKINRDGVVPEYVFPVPRIGISKRRVLIQACIVACAWEWRKDRLKCLKNHNRAYDEAHRRANDKVKDLVDRWHRPQGLPGQSVQCGSDLSCGPEGAWEGTIRPRGH